jgi:hypothetical protein
MVVSSEHLFSMKKYSFRSVLGWCSKPDIFVSHINLVG